MAAFLFCLLPSALCISCKSSSAPATQPTTKPASVSQRQDAAMRDPFGYSPWKDEKSRVSGGGTGEYDKAGMKHDMKSVFDP
jgi:hypothetical protein